MNKKLNDFLWIAIVLVFGLILYSDVGREFFIYFTDEYPMIMGFVKFSVLATMGEYLARRLVDGYWKIKGTHCYRRAFVWGMLGVLFTFVFPIYSAGVDYLISHQRLFVFEGEYSFLISTAFWKSFWMNILFAFPMMVFHRITDTLIDEKKLFSRWPFMKIWNNMDWKNMWGFVAPSIVWFWIPAHTITFCLPSEFRIIMAAGLSICLGCILAFAKKKAVDKGYSNL